MCEKKLSLSPTLDKNNHFNGRSAEEGDFLHLTKREEFMKLPPHQPPLSFLHSSSYNPTPQVCCRMLHHFWHKHRGEEKLSLRYPTFLERFPLQTLKERAKTKKRRASFVSNKKKATAENQSPSWLRCNLTKQVWRRTNAKLQQFSSCLFLSSPFCMRAGGREGKTRSESFSHLRRNTGSSSGPRLLLLVQTDRRRMNSRLLTSTNTPTDPAAQFFRRSEVVLGMQPSPPPPPQLPQPRGH